MDLKVVKGKMADSLAGGTVMAHLSSLLYTGEVVKLSSRTVGRIVVKLTGQNIPGPAYKCSLCVCVVFICLHFAFFQIMKTNARYQAIV